MDYEPIMPEETPVETAQPQAEAPVESTETPVETEVENTTPQQEQPQTEVLPSLKVKFNHEEREIPYEEAVQLTQKGLNYDKLQERYNSLQSDPALSWLDRQAQQYGMTRDQLIEAYQQQEEQARLNELVQQNIPEEYAKEMLENRKFRQQLEHERKIQQQKQKQDQDYLAFFDEYPNVKPEEIPATVWQDVEKGRSLVDAYAKHENQQLRAKIKVLEQNAKNAQTAPVGGVTTHGSDEPAEEDAFLRGFNSI